MKNPFFVKIVHFSHFSHCEKCLIFLRTVSFHIILHCEKRLFFPKNVHFSHFYQCKNSLFFVVIVVFHTFGNVFILFALNFDIRLEFRLVKKPPPPFCLKIVHFSHCKKAFSSKNRSLFTFLF